MLWSGVSLNLKEQQTISQQYYFNLYRYINRCEQQIEKEKREIKEKFIKELM